MKRKIITALMLFGMALSVPVSASAEGYSDVPAGSWAEPYIARAGQLGIMGGYGGGIFGYGSSVTRAEFAAMLVRLFGWELYDPAVPTFSDAANRTAWYYDEVETAVKNGAVTADSAVFRPDDAITREEMAVMLVRGLGFSALAESLKNPVMPFEDVTSNAPSITLAYDFGIINGVTETAFHPSSPATREQAAAMMLRLYDRYFSKIGWTHAFYAEDAYGQKDLLNGLDAISYGWGYLEYDTDLGTVLYTPTATFGDHTWPKGYAEVPALVDANGIPGNLNVYMTASRKVTMPGGTVTDACSAILLDETQRASAVAMIMSRLKREGLYAGVTIDFEEMRGPALREGFNRFLEALDAALEQEGYALYVCVHPVTSDGIYYDAYDYKTIGALADKVILMAHDYAATALTPAEMDAGFTATPVTPFYEIYSALRAITDEMTGVEDRRKIALAVSFGSIQWKTVDGKVINARAYRPGPAAIAARLNDPAAVINYSEKFQNPYMTYHNTEDNTDNIIWYEDARSVGAKAALARMFGIDSLSFWRLGLIPAAEDPADRQIYYNIPAWLESSI